MRLGGRDDRIGVDNPAGFIDPRRWDNARRVAFKIIRPYQRAHQLAAGSASIHAPISAVLSGVDHPAANTRSRAMPSLLNWSDVRYSPDAPIDILIGEPK